jgi:hypothetical protein
MFGKCIYCPREGEMSDEHYLPRCLGRFRGYELLSDRVCERCNNRLSPLDEQFCRSGPEAIIRDMLGVEGRKSHRRVSPFQRGSAGAERLTFTGQASGPDSTAEEVELDVDRKGRSVRRMRQIIFSAGDRRIAIRITDDMREPEQLLAKMKERGVAMTTPAADDTEIVTAEITGAAPEELGWMQHLLSGVRENMLGEPEISINEPDQLRVSMRANPTEKYFRGLAKIGFHYFLKHMRGFHGSEDAFAGIRDFILDGKAKDVDRFVSGRTNHLAADIFPGESPVGYRHLLIARADYEHLVCRMQFFIHPKYSSPIYRVERFALPVYTVRLGKNSSRIIYPRASRHYFTYSDEYQREGYDGEMREEPERLR